MPQSKGCPMPGRAGQCAERGAVPRPGLEVSTGTATRVCTVGDGSLGLGVPSPPQLSQKVTVLLSRMLF